MYIYVHQEPHVINSQFFFSAFCNIWEQTLAPLSTTKFIVPHDCAGVSIQFYSAHQPLDCEIDAYGDFLQALGPEATPEVSLSLYYPYVIQVPFSHYI